MFNKIETDLGYVQRPYKRFSELVGRVNYLLNPSKYSRYFEDFTGWNGVDIATTAMAGWAVTQATAGSATLDPVVNGVLLLDSASSTEGQGIQIQQNIGAYYTPAAGRKIWFSARCKIADSALDCQFFAGLAQINTTIIASNVITNDIDLIGFGMQKDDAGVLSAFACLGTDLDEDAGPTLVDDTWFLLEMEIDGLTGMRFWVDGVEITLSNITSSNFPVDPMVPTFVCQVDDGSTTPILHIDYVEVMATR